MVDHRLRRLGILLLSAALWCGCDDKSNDSENTDPSEKTEPENPEPEPEKPEPEKPEPEPEKPEPEPDKTVPDEDGDTISDKNEGRYLLNDLESVDTDGDTVPDYLDLDSDNDTIPDKIEAMNGGDPAVEPKICGDTDAFAFRTSDADENGILDKDEVGADVNKPVDSNNDTVPDYCSPDNDGDSFFDVDEIAGLTSPKTNLAGFDCNGDTLPDEFGTAEHPLDCDGDKIPDYLDTDSDNDTIEDIYELGLDTDGDGWVNNYDQDSDGDTIPDKDERGDEELPLDSDGDGNMDFLELDSDNDGLEDAIEVDCKTDCQKDCTTDALARRFVDTDGDQQSDLAEYAIAKRFNVNPADLICSKTHGVKDHIDFYFELPMSGEEKSDGLVFEPKVSKADVFLNIDNTGSMDSAINILQQEFIKEVVPAVQQRVPDSAFGVSIFRDTDAKPVWQLYLPVTEVKAEGGENDPGYQKLKAALNSVKSSNDSTDMPEAGYESLYEIATKDVSQNSQAWGKGVQPAAGTIGGAGFRVGALPIILHITDAPSNEKGHNKQAAVNALNKIGARVIPLATPLTAKIESGPDKGDWPELLRANSMEIAQAVNSVVPVCAYQKDDGDWACGENKCCTNDYCYKPGTCKTTSGEDPDTNGYCTLAVKPMPALGYPAYSGGPNALIYKTVLAIEAIVKYSTYDVSTRVVGEPIAAEDKVSPDDDKTTACFIKRIEAVSYEPPANSVVSECLANIHTAKKDFSGNGYNDGFENFAVGVAMPESPKSKLTFNVVVQNNNCVKKSTETRSFTAKIQVVAPTTNMIFAEQEVSIIVPGTPKDQIK